MRAVLFAALALAATASCKPRKDGGGVKSDDEAPPEGDYGGGDGTPAGDAPEELETGDPTEAGTVDEQTVTLIGINDLHGNIRVKSHAVDTGTERRKTKIGGIEALAAYFKIAKGANPRTLVLDAGDIYQGTIISNFFQGSSLVEAYNRLGVNASTFGNHEFDYGPADVSPGRANPDKSDMQGALRKVVTNAKFPYLSANVTTTDGQPFNGPSNPLPKSKVFELNGIKVGVIGATTLTTPTQTIAANVQGLKFTKFIDVVPAEAERLRRQEHVQLVVLLTHSGGDCNMTVAAKDGDAACTLPDFAPDAGKGPPADEVMELLKALPLAGADGKPNLLATVDVVLAGHRHRPEAHFITNKNPRTGKSPLDTLITVPVLQTTGFGKSFSMLDVRMAPGADPLADAGKRIKSINVRPPTYLCHEHFANFPDCNPDLANVFNKKYPPQLGASKPPVFLGKMVNIKEQQGLTSVFEPFKKTLAATLGDIDRVIVPSLPKPLPQDRTKESKMSNCVADAVREQFELEHPGAANKIDLMILNSSAIRDQLDDGEVTFEMLFAISPFAAKLARMELTRDELEGLGKSLSANLPSAVAVISAGWKVQLAQDASVKPRHRGFIPPAAIASKQTFTVLTNDFNALPGSPHEAVLKEARNGRITVLTDDLLQLFEKRLKTAPRPASCDGAPTDRTVLVP